MLNVVSVCDLGVLAMLRYPEQAADRERSTRLERFLHVRSVRLQADRREVRRKRTLRATALSKTL